MSHGMKHTPKYPMRLHRKQNGTKETVRQITARHPKGGFTNVPSIYGGKRLSEEAVHKLMKKTRWYDPDTGSKLGTKTYKKVSDAVSASKRESKKKNASSFQRLLKNLEHRGAYYHGNSK